MVIPILIIVILIFAIFGFCSYTTELTDEKEKLLKETEDLNKKIAKLKNELKQANKKKTDKID